MHLYAGSVKMYISALAEVADDIKTGKRIRRRHVERHLFCPAGVLIGMINAADTAGDDRSASLR